MVGAKEQNVSLKRLLNMKQREKLTSDFAGLLLDFVKDNGWLTAVSDDAGINRKKMTRKGIGLLRVHQLLRMLVALCYHSSRRSDKLFLALWWELGRIITALADGMDYYDLVDEGR